MVFAGAGEMAELMANLVACGVAYGLVLDAGATFGMIRFLYVVTTAVASVVRVPIDLPLYCCLPSTRLCVFRAGRGR